MKTNFKSFRHLIFCVLALEIGSSLALAAAAGESAGTARLAGGVVPAKLSRAVSWSQVSAKAGADYQGDGLAISPTANGARLHCVFQRLEGEATREGLWLTSTGTNTVNDRFRVMAAELGRGTACAPFSPPDGGGAHGPTRPSIPLPAHGKVSIDGQIVRFSRPGLIEEYSVSLDGVRQDFVVLERPTGAGQLTVQLTVSGAVVESAGDGGRLVLEKSGRKLVYNRLRATDATGRELTARMKVLSDPACRSGTAASCAGFGLSWLSNAPRPVQVAAPEYGRTPSVLVVVDDADAVYPVRIDPTFSDANWSSMNPGVPGTDGGVGAAVVDDSGNLYIGGSFTIAGNVPANNVAKWDGSRWSALGLGISGGNAVYALAVSGSNVYVGGDFTKAGGIAASCIAKWNGSSWSALGSGMGPSSYGPAVRALAVWGSNVYAGGAFMTAGGHPATNIAKWNGSGWASLGSGMDSAVRALAVSASNLYAGGGFTTAGGSAANFIAKWDGSSWSALGSGVNGAIAALAVSGSNLYAGGLFSMAGDSPANSIAKWDGSSWSALGSGMDSSVLALAASGGDLYAGGQFMTADGNPANYIAKWDGTSWSALGSGMDSSVFALAVSGSNVYAGADFTTAGGVPANYIAKWDGSNWSALGSGMNNGVLALTASGSDLYAGGYFTTAPSGSAANYIAKWDGHSWSALGSGMDAGVTALAVLGSDLYAGGYFTTAGGNVVNNIAKWDGNSWSALGAGLNGAVAALAVSGSDLYVGGQFTTADGNPANCIAKWNGSSWSALGSGVNNDVWALAASGSDLYAGGYFTTADGAPAMCIAKWNGSSWSALGSGIGGTFPGVFALAVAGSNVYAGGDFTLAGGVSANYIAKWNGTSWSGLGSGLRAINQTSVNALAVWGSNVYAGGFFTTAGGSVATNLAKWDGSSWSALGSGMGGGAWFPRVSALAVSGSDLYVGGFFSVAGGKASPFLARAYLPPLPALSLFRSDTDVVISWPSTDTAGFTLESATDASSVALWSTVFPAPIIINGRYTVTNPISGTKNFYRLTH